MRYLKFIQNGGIEMEGDQSLGLQLQKAALKQGKTLQQQPLTPPLLSGPRP